MNYAMWTLITIVGAAILFIVLLWAGWRAWRRTKPGDIPRTEQGTRELYAEEEQRRRDRTDDL